MQEHYFFGYLYIKSSRILALLSIVVGMAVCGNLLMDWKKTVEESQYKSNPSLVNSLSKLQQVYKDTREQTFQFMTQQGEATDKVALQPEPPVYSFYSSPEHFAELQEQINIIQKNSETLKELTYKNFSKSADVLLQRMKDHAISKKWLEPEPATKKELTEPVAPFRLFAVASNADLNDKRDGLNEALLFASELMNDAENTDSREKLTTMTNYVNGYMAILNAAGISLVTKAGEAEEDVAQKKRVFQVMSKLSAIKESVRAVIYNNWTFDFEYENTSSLIQAELKKCLDAQENVRRVKSDYVFKLTLTLLLSITVTISVLLCADFLKAILVMALKK